MKFSFEKKWLGCWRVINLLDKLCLQRIEVWTNCILKYINFQELKVLNLIKISLKCIPMGTIDSKSESVLMIKSTDLLILA